MQRTRIFAASPRAASALLCALAVAGLLGCAEDAPGSGRGAPGGDAGTGEPEPDASMPEEGRPERYPLDVTHSPLTPAVKASLKAIEGRAARSSNVFVKVGDSITASPTYFLGCFAGASFDLDGRAALEETRTYFMDGNAGGTNPFARVSKAAKSGWSASAVLSGSPSPLTTELSEVDARLAVVMFGTNDIGNENLDQYADNMLTITDQLIQNGTVPILSSIPPREKYASDGVWVRRMNAVVRGIAEARKVPFMDYFREMEMLPSKGLAGDDVHPNAYSGGPCVLTPDGLAFGYNTRNAVALASLDRVRRVIGGDAAPDGAALHLDGEGTYAAPYQITGALPFTHVGSTAASLEDRIAAYTGCAAAQDESGPEVYYEFDVAADTSVRVFVLDRGDVDVDVHLLSGSPTAEACVARDHREVGRVLTPGKWYVVVDTFVSAGAEKKGEYLLVVLPE